jgi:hypothetical protein
MGEMMRAETVIVENESEQKMNLTLGVFESNLLDCIIAKILVDPHVEEDLEFDLDETIFLSNLARHIGASGMRKYIESSIETKKVNNEYDEVVIDNDWQPECLAAFNEALESKNCK